MKTDFDIVDINGIFAMRAKSKPFEEMRMISILIDKEQQNKNLKKGVKNDKNKIIKTIIDNGAIKKLGENKKGK